MSDANLAATITVCWGHDRHSVTLSPPDWTTVKMGDELQIRGSGYRYEGEFFRDYWFFGGGQKGTLRVSYGKSSPDADGFVGYLGQAEVIEHEWNDKS